LELARSGFRCTGLDKDPERVRQINAGLSYVPDVPGSAIDPYVKERRLDATCDAAILQTADVVIVCVPTPLNKTRDPDLRFIVAAAEEIARYQHDGMLVILESTTYPGTTTEVLVPKLTAGGQILGRSIFVAFSPERVDPGNEFFTTRNTPKVLGGATPECLEVASRLYSQIIDQLVPVTSTETAEMVKLLENTFRAVNIGLVNEIAMMSRKLGVDAFEVIRAAATKPFGFMPFYPGPGLGGHCIPIDPLYLSWKLRTLQCEARFIELADSVNSGMPAYVVERTSEALNDQAKPVRGSRILIYGVAYKKNVNDCRESPAFAIMLGLRKRGARVSYMDPLVARLDAEGVSSVALDTDFGSFDAVVIVTDHSALDRARLVRQASLIIDTRDALHDVTCDRAKIYGL
ncbi:MAG TPA: nucleotide sugar dehydrogenase, partial [Polyangiaceae bacterium]|nr:nucleotide sugar dehydrogenase [Polyangiaceae bacterium]